MDEAGAGEGGGAAGGKEGGKETLVLELAKEIKALREEMAASKPKEKKDDPSLIDQVEKDKKSKADFAQMQSKIVKAAKFNLRFETFLKEYAGVIPEDAKEIAKTASVDNYPNEVERSAAIKDALMQSFFKESDNLKFLSDAQKAKWKTFLALGTAGRAEEAESIYDSVFEPAVNHARSIRQAQLTNRDNVASGSSDSDIIFKKLHEKQLRAMSNYRLNDHLHAQAKSLGLVKES